MVLFITNHDLLPGVTTYEILLVFHIVAASAWTGGVVVLAYTRSGLLARDLVADTVARGAAAWILLPASVVAVVTGTILRSEGKWGWAAWVLLGFGGWAVALLASLVLLFRPFGRTAAVALATQLLVLIVLVADMVIKPQCPGCH
jgi:hypothetical protein